MDKKIWKERHKKVTAFMRITQSTMTSQRLHRLRGCLRSENLLKRINLRHIIILSGLVSPWFDGLESRQ